MIWSKSFLDLCEGSSSGYPNGIKATTRTDFGISRIFLTSSSSKAPIQQVPNPSSQACKIINAQAMETSTVCVGWPQAMIAFDSVPQATRTTGASPMKDCPNAALASFFFVSLFLATINFQSCRLLAEGESLAASSIVFSFSSSTSTVSPHASSLANGYKNIHLRASSLLITITSLFRRETMSYT